MVIRPFQSGDVPGFMALADAEGWISDPWEFVFFCDNFPRGCLTLEENGLPVAFVMAVRYGTSGWIGNLIVATGARGRGYGTLLMARATDELLAAGVKTVWLTASAQGRPLYEKLGFREIDEVVRWRGAATGAVEWHGDPVDPEWLVSLDRAGWGDDRTPLLAAVAARGMMLRGAGGFLAAQPCGSGFQLGPWAAEGRGVASELLERVLPRLPWGARVLLDVPARNGNAASILCAAGFTDCGRTVLMCAGHSPAYDPGKIFALATMGSAG